jgi:hypothetical protein
MFDVLRSAIRTHLPALLPPQTGTGRFGISSTANTSQILDSIESASVTNSRPLIGDSVKAEIAPAQQIARKAQLPAPGSSRVNPREIRQSIEAEKPSQALRDARDPAEQFNTPSSPISFRPDSQKKNGLDAHQQLNPETLRDHNDLDRSAEVGPKGTKDSHSRASEADQAKATATAFHEDMARYAGAAETSGNKTRPILQSANAAPSKAASTQSRLLAKPTFKTQAQQKSATLPPDLLQSSLQLAARELKPNHEPMRSESTGAEHASPLLTHRNLDIANNGAAAPKTNSEQQAKFVMMATMLSFAQRAISSSATVALRASGTYTRPELFV